MKRKSDAISAQDGSLLSVRDIKFLQLPNPMRLVGRDDYTARG
jgi:hypothetical protein